MPDGWRKAYVTVPTSSAMAGFLILSHLAASRTGSIIVASSLGDETQEDIAIAQLQVMAASTQRASAKRWAEEARKEAEEHEADKP
jgi:hypothetical protein